MNVTVINDAMVVWICWRATEGYLLVAGASEKLRRNPFAAVAATGVGSCDEAMQSNYLDPRLGVAPARCTLYTKAQTVPYRSTDTTWIQVLQF